MSTSVPPRTRHIVLRPTRPATEYGYIRVDASIGPGIFAIDKFVEKPDAKIAEHYVSEGYLWNSGTFMFAPDCLSTTTNDFNRTVVVRGSPRVMIRAQTKTLCENQSMYIPIGAKHRLEVRARLT
jgi:mannose-1-phosphate guanylyltransferase